MESLHDLMGRYSAHEPHEIVAIKRYITETFKADATVGLTPTHIIITVQSGSLANALRFHTKRLQTIANSTKPIIFRIG